MPVLQDIFDGADVPVVASAEVLAGPEAVLL